MVAAVYDTRIATFSEKPSCNTQVHAAQAELVGTRLRRYCVLLLTAAAIVVTAAAAASPVVPFPTAVAVAVAVAVLAVHA